MDIAQRFVVGRLTGAGPFVGIEVIESPEGASDSVLLIEPRLDRFGFFAVRRAYRGRGIFLSVGSVHRLTLQTARTFSGAVKFMRLRTLRRDRRPQGFAGGFAHLQFADKLLPAIAALRRLLIRAAHLMARLRRRNAGVETLAQLDARVLALRRGCIRRPRGSWTQIRAPVFALRRRRGFFWCGLMALRPRVRVALMLNPVLVDFQIVVMRGALFGEHIAAA